MPCELAKEILSAYIDGELARERMGEIDDHLANCAECADELDLLRAGENTVNELVEYGVPRTFETELRRAIKQYRSPRARWWTLGGRVTSRHLGTALCIVCGVLLLAGAAYLKDMSQETLRLVAREDVTGETAVDEPSPEEPLPATTQVKTPVTPVREPVEFKPDAQEKPEPVIPPSPYLGWWMIEVGASPEFEYPVKITQKQEELVITAWGGRQPIGQAPIESGLFVSESEDLSVTIEVGDDTSAFTGTLTTPDQGPYYLAGTRVSTTLGELLNDVRGLDALINERESYGRKLSDALYRYAQSHGDRFPVALDDLVPEFVPDLDNPGRENQSTVSGRRTVYAQPTMVPTDELVDWAAYAEEELTVEDRFSLLSQRFLGRLDAFFVEMVVMEWTRFPQGSVIIYRDGSVAYEGLRNVPVLLMPDEHERIANGYERECLRNIRSVGRALVRFAADHGGLFPISTEMLWPTYLTDADALCCPEAAPHEIAYEIVCLDGEYPTADEIELDPGLLPSIVLAVEVENFHRNGFHMVTADEEVVWKHGNER